ncbi:glycosyltransferase family 4 protein [Celeribacter sp.]|uniref:glycosyltransferase family 4 protein n=1 Tax=Celeribacter sp. TaxID=1890673 RepID=UPI003A942532
MKIAVVTSQASSLLNFRGPLLTEMCKRGYEVLTFAPNIDELTRNDLVAMGVTPIETSMSRSGLNPLRELAVIFELWRLLLKHKPDVCFAYFIKPVIYGAIAAWFARVPRRYGLIEGLGFAFTSTSSVDRRRERVQKAITLLSRFTLKRLNRVIFLNPDDRREFIERRLVDAEKTDLLGGIGLDLDAWSPVPPPKNEVTFIVVARLLRDKGISEFAAAARLLRTDYPEARFVLLGGRDENPAAIPQADVDAWVAEGLIEWKGHVPSKPWFEKANIFVLPSYREGVPLSTQEAMALGRPVITTDVPGCRETVINGRNGFMVPPRDPVALAAAMRHFLEQPEDIATMGAESRKMAEEQFNVHAQNDKLLSFLGL